jgi:hypothetical protein
MHESSHIVHVVHHLNHPTHIPELLLSSAAFVGQNHLTLKSDSSGSLAMALL